jgi:hypothetical protein
VIFSEARSSKICKLCKVFCFLYLLLSPKYYFFFNKSNIGFLFWPHESNKVVLDFVPRLVLYFDDDSIVVMFCLFPFFQIKAILISLKWPEFGRNLFS